MNEYTGREIAIFTDIHGLLEPTIAILEDIEKRGIKEIYSLGDNIGNGPNPKEVLDLLDKYNVKCINGNNEEYTIIGIDPFSSYFSLVKILSQKWTYMQLTKEQIDKLKNQKHSYDLNVGGKKIGLCHFANDVRIDFTKNSTWSYQKSINYDLINPQKQFYYTNSDQQKSIVNQLGNSNSSICAGFVSAKKEPLFDGKTIDEYDEIIQGHVHFKILTEDEKVKIRTIRAVAMAYDINDNVDLASYILIKEKNIGYDIEEILVPFNRKKMIDSINNSDIPIKDDIIRYISKK